jgi:serine/threonine protein kinase/tetratricopeptide (TPR) repeat protein/WD40 repeat protein
MGDPEVRRNPVEQLAEEFLDRYRRGERPALTEYTRKHPELADEIRELFPALAMMEEVGPGHGGTTELGPRRPAGEVRIPDRLGEFRILRVVGRGGMGVVYEAVQESLGRHVALKVLDSRDAREPIRLERFKNEARSAARLHHTNIVSVFEVGEHDGTCYYAMQFIQGQGLDEVLAELRRLRGTRSPQALTAAERGRHGQTADLSFTAGLAQSLFTGRFAVAEDQAVVADKQACAQEPPPPAKPPGDSTSGVVKGSPSDFTTQSDFHYYRSVARVGLQVAEALSYAHAQKILHRDIKPANLLLDLQGTVWVTDFGLAKEEGSDLTRTGELVGTLRYMAPERYSGQSDPRSDVYSLGLTLYELLTLQPAFPESDQMRLMNQVAHEEPPRPRKLDRRLPRDLETIVLKAMAKEPQRRYQAAEALAEDLRCFLADRPIIARRASVWEHSWRWCRRNRALAAAMTSAAVLLIAVAVISVAAAFWLKNERDQATQAGQRAEAAERTARLREAEALVGQAHGIRLSRRPGQRFDALAALGKAAAIGRELGQPPGWFNRLRNEAIAALALPDLHITKEFGRLPPGSHWVDLSDDFELYVRTTDKGRCTIRRVADDTLVAPLPELGERAQAQFGRGRILAVSGRSSRRFQLWDVSGAKPSLRFKDRGITSWGFHSKGHLVALAHGDGSISVYHVATGTPLHRWPAKETVEDLSLLIHPTMPFLATSSYFSPNVWVYDLRTGAVVASAVTPWRNGTGAWSPDGRTLTVPPGDGGKILQYAFDPEAPALRLRHTLDYTQSGAAISYNPGGDHFVDCGWANKINLFDGVSGQVLFSTVALPAGSHRLRFDRTGQRLAAARVGDHSDRIGIWSVADAREYRSLSHAGAIEGLWGQLAIHPRGRLAATTLKSSVVLFDLDSGRELAQLPIAGGCGLWFDGTGNLLTNSYVGSYRWPVRPDPASPGQLLVGPPQRLPFQAGNRIISVSQDGSVIAQSMWAGYGMRGGGWIMHPKYPPRQVLARASISNCSVSPDGRWVAFDGPHIPLTVYEAASARRVWQLPGRVDIRGRFSPDRRWLVTDADGGRLYAVGTWQPGPQVGPGTPWDMTSELAVLGQANGIYRLVDLATGRELARLEDSEQSTGPAAFTPDGTKLVVAARNGLRVWDLRRMRAELAKLKLNWDAPPYPPEEHRKNLPTFQVTVDLGDLDPQKAIAKYSPALALMPRSAEAYLCRGRAYFQLKQWRQAANDLGVALALNPDLNDAPTWFELGYACSQSGRPKQALAAYARVLDLDPKNHAAWNNQGLLHEKQGELEKAVVDFSKAIELDAKDDIALLNRSRVCARLARWQKTVDDCTRFLNLAPPLRQPDAYLQRALAYGQLGRYPESQADYQKLVELAPRNPLVHNNLSWLLANCPDARVRNPARAVQLARRALELEEPVGNTWNTLGVAYYRSGNWKAAREALDKSRELRQGGDAFDFFFLAMTSWRLGQKDDARKWYKHGLEWVEKNRETLAKNPQHQDELRRFQVEAEAVLHFKKPRP